MDRGSAHAMNLPWSWGSKISEQLIWDGLNSCKHLFAGRLLDIGCGMKPYQKVFGRKVERWIGIDFASTRSGDSEATVFGSALELPFGATTFDTILSTQVLEHVSRPEVLLGEACRVLKPGGHLMLTAPQTNPLHEEPEDYFRYTCHGLRCLAERAGLHVVEIRPLGGAIATVGQMFVWHLNWVRRIPVIGPTASTCVNAGLAWMVLELDRLSPIYGGGAMKDTLNWLLVARKLK
jgi:SAM-dependent methyltransferase